MLPLLNSSVASHFIKGMLKWNYVDGGYATRYLISLKSMISKEFFSEKHTNCNSFASNDQDELVVRESPIRQNISVYCNLE